MKRINIVNEGDKFDKKKYEGALGDYDKDGLANIDDANPYTKENKPRKVEQIELAKTFEKLLTLKNQLDDTMDVTIEELDTIAPQGSLIYARTKTPYSILKKLVEKRLTDKERGLTDLVGTTIVVDDLKDLRKVDKAINKGDIGKVVEREDMYKSPKGGYRAIHYLVEVNGYIVEVQLKTKRQKAINEQSHEPYKKGTLNAEYLLYVTDLANKADKGNRKAYIEFDKIIDNPTQLAKDLDTSYEFGGEIARSYDVNINSGVGTYENGGSVSFSDFTPSYPFEKGGQTDETFIQDAVKEMEKKGTIGSFTAKAKRYGLTPQQFAKKVLADDGKTNYTLKTKRQAQFMKNANPEMFSFGGEINRSYDVNINSGVGTYAKGGVTEAGDVDFPSQMLNYAKGGEVQFRKLAKSKNFDIVTPDGRYEIEMGAFDMPKYIIVNGTRKDINTNPIAKKYRSEIQSYLDDNYAKGGKLSSIDDVDDLSAEIMLDITEEVSLKPSDVDKIKDVVEANLIKFYNKGGELMDADTEVEYSQGGSTGNLDGQNIMPDISPLSQGKTDNWLNPSINTAFVDGGGDVMPEVSSLNYAKGGKTDAKVYNVSITRKKDGYGMDLLPFDVTKSQAEKIAKDINGMKPNSAKAEIPLPFAKGGKTQGYNARLDESLAMRKGAKTTKKQSDKDRRDESKAMEKSMGKRAYSSVSTMDDFAKGGKTQGYNSRLDESLAERDGAERGFEQKKKDRRDESKAMEKSSGKRAYSSVKSMDKPSTSFSFTDDFFNDMSLAPKSMKKKKRKK